MRFLLMSAFTRRIDVLVRCAAVVGSVALLASCVAVSADGADTATQGGVIPSSKSAVFITRVGDELTISWNSRPELVYTIVSRDRTRRDVAWAPVPGYENMPGAGNQQQVVLRVPVDDPRVFNLRAVPARPPVRTRR